MVEEKLLAGAGRECLCGDGHTRGQGASRAQARHERLPKARAQESRPPFQVTLAAFATKKQPDRIRVGLEVT